MSEGQRNQGFGTSYVCPICGAPVAIDAPSCRSCGVQFAAPDDSSAAPPASPPATARTGGAHARAGVPPAGQGPGGAPPAASPSAPPPAGDPPAASQLAGAPPAADRRWVQIGGSGGQTGQEQDRRDQYVGGAGDSYAGTGQENQYRRPGQDVYDQGAQQDPYGYAGADARAGAGRYASRRAEGGPGERGSARQSRRRGLPFGNQDPDDPFASRRRLAPAGKVLLVLVVGLFLAAILNADGLRRQAESMQVGTARSVMIALTKPLTGIASVLQISRMHTAMDEALGRTNQTGSGLARREETPTPTPSVHASKSGKPSSSPSPDGGIFVPTPDNPLYVYVGGDSMAMIFGQSFQAMSSSGTKVIKQPVALDYKVSSGLARPDFFDWPKRIKAQVASYKPTTCVFISGANDGQGMNTASGVATYGTKDWDDVYSQRVAEAMDELGSKGKRQVFWVGMPNAKNAEQSAIYKHINDLALKQIETRPWVHYVDTYELFGGSRYSDYMKSSLTGKTELMRQGDGVHWSRPGGDLAADAVLKAMAKIYKFKYPD